MDEEEGLRWPYWKFGMKRDDFSSLHEQYNTTLQHISDPVAFQHDVFEISHEATSAEEFHRLMAARKQKRLNELNSLLKSASYEISANPTLIGAEQWQHAVQLFRTMSLDSLARYFASYLPSNQPWHCSDASSAPSLSGDCESFDGDSASHSENELSFEGLSTEELYQDPFEANEEKLIPSPTPTPKDNNTKEPSAQDAVDEYPFDLVPTPSRTLSFSESELDLFQLKDSCPSLHNDNASQTSASSVSDISDIHHQKEFLSTHGIDIVRHDVDGGEVKPRPHSSAENESIPDDMDSATPIAKAEGSEYLFSNMKPSMLLPSSRASGRRHASPLRSHLLSYTATTTAAIEDYVTGATHPSLINHLQSQELQYKSLSPHTASSAHARRRDASPAAKGRRGCSATVTSGRVQKPLETRRHRGRSRKEEVL